MLRACFDDCRTIGSLKLVHQSSTTLFRPRFEMSLLEMFEMVKMIQNLAHPCLRYQDSSPLPEPGSGSNTEVRYSQCHQDFTEGEGAPSGSHPPVNAPI